MGAVRGRGGCVGSSPRQRSRPRSGEDSIWAPAWSSTLLPGVFLVGWRRRPRNAAKSLTFALSEARLRKTGSDGLAIQPMAEPARQPDYATKADLDLLRADMDVLRVDMHAGFAELRAEISAAESRITWRLLGGVGALLALFRLFDLLPIGG